MWSEISIHTTHEAIEAVSNILHESGAGGVVIEDSLMLTKDWDTPFGEMYNLSPDDYPEEGVYVKAYLPVNSFLGETIEQIKESINNLMLYDIDYSPGTISITQVNEEDWASSWKKYYKPVAITEHITITPTWENYEKKDNEIVIELDPGMAFGTGTHPTTKLCIVELEKYISNNDIVYDVGCGSGVLSVVAAKLGASEVYSFDLDTVAINTTIINSKINKVDEKIVPKINNLLDGITKPADIIVANILAEVIVRLAKSIIPLLNKQGVFIASGIIVQKEQEVKAALEEAGLKIVDSNYDGDWVSIVSKRSE